MSDPDSAQRLDGWADFCDALKRAGDVVLRPGSPMDAFDRAEGFRYLSRLSRVALESYIEFADPLFPVLRRPAHETVKIGADNPDNYYQSAAISGEHEYRITGRRNTVHYLGLGTYAGSYGSKARRGQTGYLDAREMKIEPDGSFEIFLSCQEQPGRNWLRMEPDTSSLIAQTFQDRANERIADLQIARLGGARTPAPVTPAFIDRGLQAAAAYVAGTASIFAEWAEGFAKHKNELPRFDPAIAAAAHGDPNIVYYHGYFELADDEALVIDLVPPACEYWNFQLNNHWMSRSTTAPPDRAEPLRSEAPVGWLGAARRRGATGAFELARHGGHRRGTMCLRWVGAKAPGPRTRVVKLVDVAGLVKFRQSPPRRAPSLGEPP
jgi:hypothetical protein